MKRLLPILLLLGTSGLLLAQEGTKRIRLNGAEVVSSADRETARLCFHAEAGNPKEASLCNFIEEFEDDRLDGEVAIDVSEICETIHARATLTGHVWYVAPEKEPAELLYRIDCREGRAYEFIQGSEASQAPPTGTPQPAVQVVRSGQDAPAPGLDPVAISRRLERIEERLYAIEGPSGLAGVIQGQRELGGKIDDLGRGLAERAESSRCLRSDGTYGTRREVMVSVGGTVLRFLEIPGPAEPVAVGLAEEKAKELLREAQQGVEDPIYPHLFLAVPAVTRAVTAFFLQDRLIDPGLYTRLTGGGDARRVAHRDARRFIDQLNSACDGIARLALPTEEQLVTAAHLLYNPVQNGLKPCPAVADAGPEIGLADLLGHAWHLTSSPCEPFGDGMAPSCDQGSFIRKGGAASSENPLECLPEYRSTAPENVPQQETSFRLVLVE